MKSYVFAMALGAAAVAGVAMAAAPDTAGNGLSGSDEIILIAQITLLLLVGRGLGEVLQRFGQPAVVGQLLAGLILGPSLFGWLWPQAHDLIFPRSLAQKNLVSGLAEMGIMMLLLLTGMEMDLKLVRRVGGAAVTVTAAGIAVPFLCGFGLGQLLPDAILPNPEHRLVASLFLGTALSISSIKVVAMVIREMNFMHRNLGQIIVASAIMEDTVGWIIIALALGIAGAGGIATGTLAKTVIGTILFLVFSYTIGRRLVFRLIRWVNDTFVSEYAVTTAILIVMCVMALMTQAIGVNVVLGAFVAGVLVGESPILSQHIEDQLRGFITAFLMPIFFGLSGLTADLTILKDPKLALLTVGLIAIASIGKFTGAFAGGMVSGLSSRESFAVGCAMNARGSTEVIVASIGLTTGALTQNLYTMIVTMAVVTTMAMPPMLRSVLRRLPLRKEEQARLKAEEIDAKGLVNQFERLLIAADESANGKFALRIAGFVAGQLGKPITFLHKSTEVWQVVDTHLKGVIAEHAEAGNRAATDEKSGDKPDKADVSARADASVDDAIAKEAPKGYDVLFVGLTDMSKSDGRFAADVDRAAAGFEGPLTLSLAGHDAGILEKPNLNILVPVSGTDASRRGAEMAYVMSSAKDSTVTVLHVADRAASEKRPPGRQRAKKNIENAVLEDAVSLAKRHGYEDVRTAIRVDLAPDIAILKEAERCGADVIVIGANRRVGEQLYLGKTVAGVLRNWRGGIVIVAV